MPTIWLRKSGLIIWGGAVASEYGALTTRPRVLLTHRLLGSGIESKMTSDGTYIQMYVDGVVSGLPVAATLYLASGPLFIGTYGDRGVFPISRQCPADPRSTICQSDRRTRREYRRT